MTMEPYLITTETTTAPRLVDTAGDWGTAVAGDHPPPPGRGEIHETLRAAAKLLADVYDRHCPPSRELWRAFTAVHVSLMWANAALDNHDPAGTGTVGGS